LHLLQEIRDESHRFAITGHKQRRDKKRRTSSLEGIPGVGAKRRRELLRHFGGLQAIEQASINDLLKVPGISKKIADDIYSALRNE
jgi:excinuclease ABC subunit C